MIVDVCVYVQLRMCVLPKNMRLCRIVYVCIAYKQIIYFIHSHNNREQTIDKTTIDMSDSEFSSFEEDGKYDEKGCQMYFQTYPYKFPYIKVISMRTPIGLIMCLLMC